MSTTPKIEEILKSTHIHQILRPKLIMATPDTTLQEALDLMRTERSGYIVVTDVHSRCIGMFTEREVLMRVMHKGVSMAEPITKYMRTDVHTLKKTDSVSEAVNAMFKFNIRHVPLVDEFDQLCGVLSIRTVAHFLSELLPKEVLNLPPRPQIHTTVEGG